MSSKKIAYNKRNASNGYKKVLDYINYLTCGIKNCILDPLVDIDKRQRSHPLN